MTSLIKRLIVLMVAVALWDSASAAPVFPVRYSANSRYLVDQNGTPFPIMGRTAWFVVSLSVANYRLFVDDTAARGYNAIELHVLNHDPRGNNPPFCGNGSAPFLKRLDGATWSGTIGGTAPDFTTPNETYWSFVDGFLAYCESKGILVFMFPAYVGWQGGEQGWMQELVANGPTKAQSYGTWIATRYKDQKNLVWMMGGDMGTSPYTFNSAQTAAENGLLNGLKSVAGQQSTLFSAEWTFESIATDQTSFGTSMTLNGVYSFSGYVSNHGRRAYARTPVEPAFLLEEPYDQEGSDGNGANPSASQPVRRFQWWGWLSTIGGYVSGNGYVWRFRSPDWQNHLDSQGTRDMARLNAFMTSIAWFNLVPSGLGGMRTLITSGGSSVNNSDYVTASATPDGALLVAYVPPDHSGPIAVDMGAMSAPVRARWFDPTSAAYSTIGTGLPNSGSRSFSTPGNNSSGYGDWVLVLDSVAGNSPPTISDIPNQSTPVNTPTPAISFTIQDAQTPAGSLTLGKSSSNATLVPTNNIVFGGSGGSRTITITPASSQTGTSTIIVNVSDGTNSTSDTFVLTVTGVNTPPTITGLAAQTINEDATTGPLSFTIGDAETPAASLALGKTSSNPTLVPTNNIVFGGSGANRTVTVSPAPNQNGTATITVSVSDGQFTVSTNFLLTVNAVNDPPTVSSIANQIINVNGTTGPLNFTVGDAETAAGSLTLGKSSSNPTLVPTNSIVFGGSGSNRTVTVTSASGQTGSVVIAISVSDGQSSVSTSFGVTVGSSQSGTKTFTNATAITIPSQGAVTPYPSTINVAGLGGMISNVTLTLRNLTHTWTPDIDVLLVSPAGQKVVVMSDAGNGGANNVTLTLSDAAASSLPSTSLVSGTYRPANYTDSSSGGDNFPGPAPAGPYASALSGFNAQPANGVWSLYVFDDGSGDQGSIAGGWILTITTSGVPTIPQETPSQIISMTLDAARTVRVTVRGDIGRRYALEASSTWNGWIQVDAQNNTTGSVQLSEASTTNSSRFYRIVSVP
jgi:subtilisin-like proprotein convertase family protein